MTGRLIQTYRIDELLGEGGMGTVYRATDTVLERPVALKMLRAELLAQPQFLDRFRAEAQILARLNHPNVATLYNFVREEGDYYMVMEFVEGQTLDQWLWQYGPLPVPLAIQIVQQALEGLHHAHKRGILHRDLKPANLMVTPEGVVKLTDFGIARIIGSQRMTHVNGLVGTPAYMAPEQIQGLEPSPQSDIHAMGLVLYELLSGQVPFATTNQFETMERVMRMMPPPLRPQLSGIPPALDDILSKALLKKPEDRFADARQFQKALLTILPYASVLDEADVLGYQHPATPAAPSVPVTPPAPAPAPDSGKTWVDNRPTTPPPVVESSTPKAIPKPAPANIISVRDAAPKPPAPGRSRWKRVALWVVGIFVGFVVVINILYGPGRNKATTQPADSLTTVAPLSVNSVAGTPDANKVDVAQNPPPAPVENFPKESKPLNDAARPAQKRAKEASKPASGQPTMVKQTNSPVSNPASMSDDDDPVPTPRQTPRQPPAPSALPSPASPTTEKPLPRPEPTDDRVAESRTAKAEPAETKGGTAPRSLKLSGGTEVVVTLAEPLAAATAKDGQSISLQVSKAVSVRGEVVIPQGATVQGEVSGVSTGGKKDMLEIRIQSVRGLGGQRISVKGGTFRYVGDRNEPLVFKSGQQFVVYTAGSHQFSF